MALGLNGLSSQTRDAWLTPVLPARLSEPTEKGHVCLVCCLSSAPSSDRCGQYLPKAGPTAGW